MVSCARALENTAVRVGWQVFRWFTELFERGWYRSATQLGWSGVCLCLFILCFLYFFFPCLGLICKRLLCVYYWFVRIWWDVHVSLSSALSLSFPLFKCLLSDMNHGIPRTAWIFVFLIHVKLSYYISFLIRSPPWFSSPVGDLYYLPLLSDLCWPFVCRLLSLRLSLGSLCLASPFLGKI